MTFDPPKRKAEGEPGRFSRMINVTLRQRRIDCMVGIDLNLYKGDRVLRRGYVGERTHRTPTHMYMYMGILTLLQAMLCLCKSCKAITLTYTAVELLRTLLRDSTARL